MEATYTWTARRDALLDQLSELLNQLQEHEEGPENSNDLLDHLDGTRRALDRFAAILTDKYVQPSSTEFFSPGVSRPTSTATIASDASTATTSTTSKTRSSMGSFASYQSSPTTLISDPDVSDSLRRRILEEDDSHVIIDDEDEDDAEEGGEVKDTDESFERLSLMLNRVLEEAHAAISLPASPMRTASQYGTSMDEGRIDQVLEDDGRSTATMSSAAETVRPKSALDAPFESLPKRAGKLPRSIVPLTPEMMHATKPDNASSTSISPSCSLLLPVPKLDLTESHISTKSNGTATTFSSNEDDGSMTAMQASLQSMLESSLDMITGDYVNDIIREIRMSEAIGNNVWMVLVGVAMMWCFVYVSQGWGCACEVPVR